MTLFPEEMDEKQLSDATKNSNEEQRTNHADKRKEGSQN
jgi:hypothetical protein